MTDPARTRTTTWTDPQEALPSLAALDGLEYLRRVSDGRLPPPPIADLFGMRFSEVEAGRFTVSCEPSEAFYNPLGTIHGGVVGILLDTALGCATHSTLAAGVGYTSVDLQVQYLRPVLPSGGTLTATGRLVKGGRRVAFAAGELHDAAGTLLATATSSLLIIGG